MSDILRLCTQPNIDEIVILSRALEADEIAQLLNGWDEAFAVEPEGKLATTWARVKTAR